MQKDTEDEERSRIRLTVNECTERASEVGQRITIGGSTKISEKLDKQSNSNEFGLFRLTHPVIPYV